MSKDFVSLEVYDQIKNLKEQLEHERRYSKALESRISALESEQQDRCESISVSKETANRIMEILDREPRKPSCKLLQDAEDFRDNVEVKK